jgi:hypothetical protein
MIEPVLSVTKQTQLTASTNSRLRKLGAFLGFIFASLDRFKIRISAYMNQPLGAIRDKTSDVGMQLQGHTD